MKNVSCALMALALCCLIPAAQAKRAPNLELKDLAGHTHKLSELRGSIVVINFWATWCAPCREELPLLSQLSHLYGGKNLHFIAISADEPGNRARIDQFLSRAPLAMDVWLGADLDTLERLGLGNELPATMILDEQGEIVTRILGQAREEDVKGPVEWLLGGKAGPAPSALVNRY